MVGDQPTITAASGSLTATASVAITGQTLGSWRAAHFTNEEIESGLAADLADADGDRLSNLLEYALGSNPRAVTPALVPTLEEGRLTLTFTRPKALPNITYIAEATSDMEAWTPVALELVSDGDPQTMRARDAAREVPRFMRLRVTRAE